MSTRFVVGSWFGYKNKHELYAHSVEIKEIKPDEGAPEIGVCKELSQTQLWWCNFVITTPPESLLLDVVTNTQCPARGGVPRVPGAFISQSWIIEELARYDLYGSGQATAIEFLSRKQCYQVYWFLGQLKKMDEFQNENGQKGVWLESFWIFVHRVLREMNKQKTELEALHAKK